MKKFKNLEVFSNLDNIFLVILLLILLPLITLAQDWKHYPYLPQESVVVFPGDEGWHPGMDIEWWYTNAHVTGLSTGAQYSFMLTYFYYPIFDFEGFRIFNLANETTGEFYQETLFYNIQEISENYLNIQVLVSGGSEEEWVTQQNGNGELIPFKYHLYAQSEHGYIDLEYDTIKRPLIFGGDGLVYLGQTGNSYYYSQTLLTVQGILSLKGIGEEVSGFAWIDRQYGEFNPNVGELYEWFCYQLSNGMDLNVWNIFNNQDRIPDTENYRICTIYVDDDSSLTTSDFKLERLKYSFSPDSQRCYAQKWHFTYQDIDLIITTVITDQEVLLPFRFYEGSTVIEGTVNEETVTGFGFAELLHFYEHPDLRVLSPNGGEMWDGTLPVTWKLLNPDDGRPVLYDLEVSTDDKKTFMSIVKGIPDTMYYWDAYNIPIGTSCWLRVKGYSVDSTLFGFDESDTSFVIGITGIENSEKKALTVNKISTYASQNPDLNQVSIHFQLPKANSVSLKIYNIRGQLVYTLLDQYYYNSGQHKIIWNGRDKFDNLVASGIYLYRLNTKKLSASGRIILIH